VACERAEKNKESLLDLKREFFRPKYPPSAGELGACTKSLSITRAEKFPCLRPVQGYKRIAPSTFLPWVLTLARELKDFHCHK
jgi:hypothetical protein